MEDNKTFKILTIDGGGIKGLYSAVILRDFEEKYQCSISDHFDMVCGTSTGGLIALALSLKIPAKKICDFYETEGPNIFPSSKTIKLLGFKFSRRIIGQLLYKGKYSDKPLREALEKIFGDKRIGDSHNLLCIPSFTVTEARPFVFKFDHKEGDLDRDNKTKMVEVALATSAAPTYFPMAEISRYNNKQFVDGGIWANDPTIVGLLEAMDFFVGSGLDRNNNPKRYNKIKILSLSSLSIAGGKPTGLERFRSFSSWRDELFETMMTGQSYFTEFFMKRISEFSDLEIDYVRIPSSEVSREQEHLIQLDVASKEALQLMKGKGEDQADKYKKKAEIADFFVEEKTYKITNNTNYGELA